MAKYHMYHANKLYLELKAYNPSEFLKLCKRINLSYEEVDEMRLASEAMFLPYDKELGIHEQDDSFLSKAIWDFANTEENNYP